MEIDAGVADLRPDKTSLAAARCLTDRRSSDVAHTYVTPRGAAVPNNRKKAAIVPRVAIKEVHESRDCGVYVPFI